MKLAMQYRAGVLAVTLAATTMFCGTPSAWAQSSATAHNKAEGSDPNDAKINAIPRPADRPGTWAERIRTPSSTSSSG